jgi:hypothetical protein
MKLRRLLPLIPLLLTGCQLRDDISPGFIIAVVVFVGIGCVACLLSEVV